MEYPFKDLMPLDEVLAREGYYKDWTHLDPEVFYSLTQISEYIKTKGYGVDVRLLIAQLAEHFGLKTTQVVDLGNLIQDEHATLKQQVQQAVAQVNADRNALETQFNQSVAQMQAEKDAVIANATVDSEVILARGGKPTLQARLDDTTAQLAQTGYQVPLSYSTPNIQNVLDNQRKIRFLDGEYVIDSPIFIKSDTEITFSPNTVFKAKKGSFSDINQVLCNIIGVSNIKLNGKLKIIMNKEEYTTGEWRHGLSIISVKGLKADVIEVIGSGGDGVYFGTNHSANLPEDIQIGTIIADNNRRNGVTFVAGKNIFVDNIIAKNTVGALPEFGVDFEPNFNTDLLQNIVVNSVYTENNAKGGIVFAIGKLRNSLTTTSVTVNNIYSLNDGQSGALRVAYNEKEDTTQLLGSINVRNVVIENPKGRGVDFYNYSSKSVKVNLENCKVINVGSDNNLTNIEDLSGYVMQTNVGDMGGSVVEKVGNINLVNCIAIDTRETKRMFIPFHFPSSARLIEKLKFKNCEGEGQTNDNLGFLNIGKGEHEIVSDKYKMIFQSVSGNAINFVGSILSSDYIAPVTYVLPLASEYPSAKFMFKVSTSAIEVRPQSSDRINQKGANIGQDLIGRDVGSFITVKSNGENGWDIIEDTGYWSLQGFSSKPLIVYASAPPGTGEWKRGDIVYNTLPSSNSPIGWTCVTTGTPGTWRRFGVIDVVQ